MKKQILLILAVIALFSCKNEKKNSVEEKETIKDITYTITASGWDKYNGDHFRISVKDTTPSRIKLVHDPIIKNGGFTVQGKIEHPEYAYFGIYDKEGEWKYYKGDFILEHGEITVDYDSLAPNFNFKPKSHKTSGKYTDIVLNDIRYDVTRIEKFNTLKAYADQMAANRKSPKDTTGTGAFFKLNNDLNRYTQGLYDDLRANHKDPYARLLAIAHSRVQVDPESELKALEKEIGALTPEMTNVRDLYKSFVTMNKNKKTVGVGMAIKDFSAKNLNGEEFRLADVLKKNKYTLVEFWASWCSPCRAEIPHLKKTYKKFNNKGFEIVSFTLDDSKDRWAKASKEENMPWIDVGDLLAHKSPVTKMYGVSSIPDNYLVDGNGVIVANKMRHEELNKKLEELLDR
ncbi:redoxin domain-containing protein [Maribacter sp. 2304DJ31-5]|uniref:redoxin domain-containing protein n=1 Tax=Maribacter sp. 2304DJ31-5 TaxID=3386273 RepID=UPI0039BC5B72